MRKTNRDELQLHRSIDRCILFAFRSAQTAHGSVRPGCAAPVRKRLGVDSGATPPHQPRNGLHPGASVIIRLQDIGVVLFL